MDGPRDSDDSSAQLRVRQGSRITEGASIRLWSYYQRAARAMTEKVVANPPQPVSDWAFVSSTSPCPSFMSNLDGAESGARLQRLLANPQLSLSTAYFVDPRVNLSVSSPVSGERLLDLRLRPPAWKRRTAFSHNPPRNPCQAG
jgi:hypothetical protein